MTVSYLGMILLLASGLAAVGLAYRAGAAGAQSAGAAQKAAYLVVSHNVRDPEKMALYKKAAVPLAEKAGYKVVAADKFELLEGKWPYEGGTYIARFSSMEALNKYWHSPEFAEAKKLRLNGVSETNFIFALEAAE